MNWSTKLFVAAFCAATAGAAHAAPWSYRGTLFEHGAPAEGRHEMRLTLYDAPYGGRAVALPITMSAVDVAQGAFATELDVPDDLAARSLWVGVEVRDVGGAFIALSERTALGAASPACWDTSGNSGTDAAVNFLGTTDAQPLELRVSNERIARFEPTVLSPSAVLGHAENGGSAGVRGVTIAGGGTTANADADFTSEGPNRVTDAYGSIGGGSGNSAGNNTGTSVDAAFATVAGGLSNAAFGLYATVAGGVSNYAQSNGATIGGGFDNGAFASRSTIAGGTQSYTFAAHATVGGGLQNFVRGTGATIPGGIFNQAGGDYSFAVGRRAKVRDGGIDPVLGTNEPGCDSGGTGLCGDEGSVVFADATDLDFVSTGSNQFLVRASGGMGVTHASFPAGMPENQLHVRQSVVDAAHPQHHVAQIDNFALPAGGDVLALRVRATQPPTSSTNFVTFFDGNYVDGDGNPAADRSLGAIEGNSAGGVVFSGPGSDYAEYLERIDARERIAPGDVVGVHGGRISRRTDGADQLLVASTGAIVAGNDPGAAKRDAYTLVAFVGQAHVRVRGAVRAGDYLLASSRNDGRAIGVAPHALSAADLPRLVGRAWDSDEGGRVRAVVGLARLDATLLERFVDVARRNDRLERENAALAERVARIERRLSEAALAGRTP